MAKFSNRDHQDSKKPDPYNALGLSSEDRVVGSKVPKIHQTVSKLGNKNLSTLEQKSYRDWMAGAKFQELTAEQQNLAKRLADQIDANTSQLADAANVSAMSTAVVAPPTSPARSGSFRMGESIAPASALGESFHNPYTFIPFGEHPKRGRHTPLTIDEIELDRVSGVLVLDVRTMSPLLTCSPKAKNPQERDHKQFSVLAIGQDVIVPASGIRGALRTLMTIITGGTLGYIDSEIFLTQGRDNNLGPAGKKSPSGTPRRVFLAEVVEAGSSTRAGRVRLGQTRLIKANEAALSYGRELPRPEPGVKEVPLWAELQDDVLDQTGMHSRVLSFSTRMDTKHSWRLKLSGRPVDTKDQGKREGAFLGDGPEFELPAFYWSEYQGRHRHGDHPQLRNGDLVWLDPNDVDIERIERPDQILGLQWARWGRTGEQLEKCILRHHKAVFPDSLNDDGNVDEISDLFGQVPVSPSAAGPFAARIRPENLVFFDKRSSVNMVALAPLSAPHPGCVAFYRDVDSDGKAGRESKLRGYKVYRNTLERGSAAPWKFETQGSYGKKGEPLDSKQRSNKSCELLPEGEDGTLRISFRSLTQRELSLLVLACSVDWRLGGGKPLGLGHCRVTRAHLVNENGSSSELFQRSFDGYPDPANIGSVYKEHVIDLVSRVNLWHESQRPVVHLRYPRAVKKNGYSLNRGGHVWFGRHAAARKGQVADGSGKSGLQILRTSGKLSQQIGGRSEVSPQPLPSFSVTDVNADLLYGYDLFSGVMDRRVFDDNSTVYSNLEPFNPAIHAKESHQSGGNTSQNSATRQTFRDERP